MRSRPSWEVIDWADVGYLATDAATDAIEIVARKPRACIRWKSRGWPKLFLTSTALRSLNRS